MTKLFKMDAAALASMATGSVIEYGHPRFFLDGKRVRWRQIERLLGAGWIYPTREPGGKYTGRFVITNMGHRAVSLASVTNLLARRVTAMNPDAIRSLPSQPTAAPETAPGRQRELTAASGNERGTGQ